jgi:hypothetical protein
MYQILKIKAGKHYASFRIPKLHFFKKEFQWDIEMSSANRYPFEAGKARSEQINKLFGFSNGLIRHKDEFRVGWRCNKDGNIDLYCYYYINGVRPSLPEIEVSNYLDTVSFEKEFSIKIKKMKSGIRFIVMNHEYNQESSLKIPFNKRSKIGWMLRPYNGGRKTYKTDFYFKFREL